MIDALLSLLTSPGPARSLALLLLEVSALLAVAWVAARLLHRAPAAGRHLLWTAATGAVLVLAAGLLLPSAWRMEVPVSVLQPQATAFDVGEAGGPRPVPVAAEIPRPTSAATAARAAPRGPGGGPAGSLLIVVWTLGALLVAARRGAGGVALAELLRRASPVDDPTLLGMLERTASRVGVRRPVRLLWLDREGSPGTCGVLSPTILLPPSARRWTRERLELVLVHELVHISRADTLTGMVADVACAVAWMHPGVWAAARRLREERERACDEAVLRCGVRAPVYARALLSIVGEYGESTAPPVLAMADRRVPALERRIRWLLTGRAPTRPLPASNALTLLLLTLLPAALLACAEFTAPVVEPEGDPDAAAEAATPGAAASELTPGASGSGQAPTSALPPAEKLPPTSMLPGAGAFDDDAADGDPRLGCWARDTPARSRPHAVVVLFEGLAEAGRARLRLVPERIQDDGAGLASVRHDPGMRCWRAGIVGVRLAGRWGPTDVATVHYSHDSEIYFASPEGIERRIHPPSAGPFECELPAGAGDSRPSCRPATAGAPGVSKEQIR